MTRVLEIGPGRVLTGLVARIDRALERANLAWAADLDAAAAFATGSRDLQRSEGISMELEERVSEIIVEQLDVQADQVTEEASFIEDLGADSLDTVELVMALEENFDIEIPDEDAEKIKTVRDAVSYIDEHVKSAN